MTQERNTRTIMVRRRSNYHIVCYLKFLKAIGHQAWDSRSKHTWHVLNHSKCFASFCGRLKGHDNRVSFVSWLVFARAKLRADLNLRQENLAGTAPKYGPYFN